MNAGDPAVLFNKASSPSNTSATPKSAICYYKNILLILFNPFTPELPVCRPVFLVLHVLLVMFAV